jgi:hypothetical protein
MKCCHCASLDIDAAGGMHPGWPYPLCTEHHSYFMRKAAKPKPVPVRIVTLPASAEARYIEYASLAALGLK